MTPVYAELGADGYISYINASGNTAISTPYFGNTAGYARFIASSMEFGYWYDPNADDDLTSYGVVKWEAGVYEEMILLYVEISEDFHGGEIVMSTNCSSGNDTRGGTVMENGDQGITFTCSCNVSYAGSSTPEAYACYTSSDSTLTFYYDGQRSTRSGTTYDVNTGNSNPEWYSDGTYSSVTLVVFNSSFADARPTLTCSWFRNMTKLRSITGMQYLNTTNVTNMANMFFDCTGLTSLDVSHFNTDKVTSMYSMFRGCSGLTSLDVSNFNTANVTYMSRMFYNCSGLTSLDVSNFNIAKVTNMSLMFFKCSGLTSLDLSNFNTAKVTNMDYMFSSSSGLTTIYVGDSWSTAAVTSSTNMFYNCTKLVGGKGTTYDSNHVDAAYAHIDGGTSNPGYFTAALMRGDVNHDGSVSISDVTALIKALLNGDVTVFTDPAADCDQNGGVSISDVTCLVTYLLNSSW